jgi:hypothetical protein
LLSVFWCYWVVELRVLQELSHLSQDPVLFFALVIFQGGFHFFLSRATLDYSPPTYTFFIAGILQVRITTSNLFVEMGSHCLTSFLPGLASNFHSSNLCFLTSLDYRYAPPCLALSMCFNRGYFTLSTLFNISRPLFLSFVVQGGWRRIHLRCHYL